VAPAEGSAGKVLRGHAGELKIPDRAVLPPVPLVHISCSTPLEKRAELEWSVPHYGGIALGKSRNCCRIKVIVVGVGEEDYIDGWKAVEVDRRRNPASRTNELHW